MKIPAIRKGYEDEGIQWLDVVGDVTQFSRMDKRIEIHTKTDIFYLPTTLEDWRPTLKEFGFEKLDAGNIVNLSQIVQFDEYSQKVYFDEEITKNSQHATVARVHLDKVKHFKKVEKK